jgi:hypothetical protein
MKARGIGAPSLSKQTGCVTSAIACWRGGENLPRLETAVRLSEALSWPPLADIVRDSRAGACQHCGRGFLNQGGAPKRYCSSECRDIAATIRDGKGVPARAAVAERRLARHVGAVAAFCAGCEPAGLCRDSACALRPVSPLPLSKGGDDAMPVHKPEGAWGPTSRPVMLTAIRAANAERWERPGEREAMSERQRAHFAAMTHEERAERGRRVSAGRRAGLAARAAS